MSGAVVLVAVAAAVGNLLQGWDNAAIAGAILYIKQEFKLETQPEIEGLIMAMSLIGAFLVTIFSGAIADCIGRRIMLITSSILCFVSGFIVLWAPNLYILLLGRLVNGFGLGLAVTIVPIYISETAPPEIRGLLNTLPQFTGCLGMFFSYIVVFGMSFMNSPSWRLVLSFLFIPSIFYFILTTFYLPESPRWLVSKGRVLEAKHVLKRLRGTQDVSGELALLVEGLRVGGETSIEQYIIGPANEAIDDLEPSAEKEEIKLYGPEGLSSIARPISGQNVLGDASRRGSILKKNMPLVDPLVALFGSVNEKLADTGSKGSMYFPHLGSMFSVAENQPRNEEWDEESLAREGEEDIADTVGDESEDNLQSPLISRQATGTEKDIGQPSGHMQASSGEPLDSARIGGGWQLALKWTEREGADGNRERVFKRIFLHEGGGPGKMRGSLASLPDCNVPPENEFVQAAALVSQPALYSKELTNQHPAGPALIHPSETPMEGPSWNGLFEPGVKHALVVGVGIQLFQQLSGINGVLHYTPQILEQAGAGVLLSEMGVSSASTSLLISAITALLMLPSVAVAMRLMDLSGRRGLLLSTIPVLIVTLVILFVGNEVNIGNVTSAAVSSICVLLYFCFFVVGFGPIPDIFCSEIFPTPIRGISFGMCALTFWIGDIIVTYTLPMLLSLIGLGGVFGIYTVMCVISWVFVFLKVPETKGMPLEVISEMFSVGAKQAMVTKNN